MTEILRALLDPESMIQDSEKNDFLHKFYDAYIDQLMGVIEAGTEKSVTHESHALAAASQSAPPKRLALICFLHRGHSSRTV